MKPTTSLYPFFTSMVICKVSIIFIIIILICRKLGSVGPAQQKKSCFPLTEEFMFWAVYIAICEALPNGIFFERFGIMEE